MTRRQAAVLAAPALVVVLLGAIVGLVAGPAHWLAAGRNAETLEVTSPWNPAATLSLRLIPYSDDLWLLVARDVSRLTLLRRTLRQKVAASSLCDAEKFTKILGMAYREMWTYWCQTRGKAAMLTGAPPRVLE